MILLDTNVISEMLRPQPDPVVVSWFKRAAGLPLYTTTVTEAELWSGVYLAPDGKRRTALHELISETLSEDFAGRIVSFDSAAAMAYAKINARRSQLGRPIATADCQIAAIAQVRGFKVATRDVAGFENCDIEIVDPWSRQVGVT
jgi:toxin FitB